MDQARNPKPDSAGAAGFRSFGRGCLFLPGSAGVYTGRTAVMENAFSFDQVLGLSVVYMIFFFCGRYFIFTYHFIEQYNKSLKYEASMVEIELNNLKSQLNRILFLMH